MITWLSKATLRWIVSWCLSMSLVLPAFAQVPKDHANDTSVNVQPDNVDEESTEGGASSAQEAGTLLRTIAKQLSDSASGEILEAHTMPADLESIYSEDRFNKEKTHTCYNSKWSWLNFVKPCKATLNWGTDPATEHRDLSWLARLLEFAMWLALAVVLVILVLYLIKHLRGVDLSIHRRINKEQLPEYLKALVDEDYTNLRADIEALIAKQAMRQAMALLYRAAIAALLHRALPIKRTHTELEILHSAQRSLLRLDRRQAASPSSAQGVKAYEGLRRITEAWRRVAYRHETISAASLLELLEHHEQAILSLPSELDLADFQEPKRENELAVAAS